MLPPYHEAFAWMVMKPFDSGDKRVWQKGPPGPIGLYPKGMHVHPLEMELQGWTDVKVEIVM